MKRFKTIQDWLATNPTQEEQTKVLILIHRGEAHATRKAVYEKEQYLRKLQRGNVYLEKVGIKPPKEVLDTIKATKAEIAELRKDLPAPVKRAKEKASVE